MEACKAALEKALGSGDARQEAAAALASAVKAAGNMKAAGVHDALKAALDSTDASVRESAVACFTALVQLGLAVLEPSLVAMLPAVLERCSDKVVSIRGAAEAAVKAMSAVINPNATKKV